MIPKVIHFCWLSGEPYPPIVNTCIESWIKYLSDYEIILWDTHRIDINSNLWLKQAFEARKYAFAADYIRFYALYNYGGIYLDADVEVIKSFDSLLEEQQFLGEEAGGDIEAAVMGAEQGSPWVKECLDYYIDRPFIKDNGNYDMRPVPLLISEIVADKKEYIDVKPFYYFSPKNFCIGDISIREETYCIHHFDGKWVKKDFYFTIKMMLHRTLYFLFGRTGHNKIIKFIRKQLS